MELLGPPHYFSVFIIYTFSVLFKLASCCLRALFFFCSLGVRSGVTKRDLISSGFSLDLNLILFLNIVDFSSVLLTEILSSQALVDF